MVGVQGVVGYMGCRGPGSRCGGVLGLGVIGGVSRCHLKDRLPKLWLLHYFWFWYILHLTPNFYIYGGQSQGQMSEKRFSHAVCTKLTMKV